MKSITILTHAPGINIESIKWFAARLIKKNRGPHSVFLSLCRGLSALGISYRINPPEKFITDTVHVLNGTKALAYAIRLKKQSKIKALIAGPNVVVLPSDNDNLITDSSIDVILLPSKWTRDLYSSVSPSIQDRLRIWPAGTAIPTLINNSIRSEVIIYRKKVPDSIYTCVVQELEKRDIHYTVLEYGNFNQNTFFKLLEKSVYMIYLQEVESQGIALQEAWAHNVPTLVWNKGDFTYSSGHRVEGNISAPYLNEKTGMFFKNQDDFAESLNTFLQKLSTFTPRAYCIEHLSDEASAKAYVKIIESLN